MPNGLSVKPLRKDLETFLVAHGLKRKWEKAKNFFESDLRHPSLHTELLEPHWRGIYSFRLDKTYRALFFIADGKAEVFQITNHYQ